MHKQARLRKRNCDREFVRSLRVRELALLQAGNIKIKEDANFLADQEVKMARQKMREEMANQAATTARELVQRNISGADQSRLVAEFIQTIG